jgi:hypothetical protein
MRIWFAAFTLIAAIRVRISKTTGAFSWIATS